jgi:hypothetical protein
MKKDKKQHKPASEMTTEELADRVFGKDLKGRLKEIAHEGEKSEKPKKRKKS